MRVRAKKPGKRRLTVTDEVRRWFTELQKGVEEIEEAFARARGWQHDTEELIESVRRCSVGIDRAKFAAAHLDYELTRYA
jgi:hypothetical protein